MFWRMCIEVRSVSRVGSIQGAKGWSLTVAWLAGGQLPCVSLLASVRARDTCGLS